MQIRHQSNMLIFRISLIVMLFATVLLFPACEKDPGEGGNSQIKGTVLERNYSIFPSRYTEAGAKDLDIYIIYGDDGNAFDDRTRTSFDGSYKFSNLKKGKYRIFVYSDDTAAANFGNTIEVIREIEIEKNRTDNEVTLMTIIKL